MLCKTPINRFLPHPMELLVGAAKRVAPHKRWKLLGSPVCCERARMGGTNEYPVCPVQGGGWGSLYCLHSPLKEHQRLRQPSNIVQHAPCEWPPANIPVAIRLPRLHGQGSIQQQAPLLCQADKSPVSGIGMPRSLRNSLKIFWRDRGNGFTSRRTEKASPIAWPMVG